NRDLYGADFRWIAQDRVASVDYPEDVYTLERSEYGNFYGRFLQLEGAVGEDGAGTLQTAWARAQADVTAVDDAAAEVAVLTKRMDRVQNDMRHLQYRGAAADSPEIAALVAEQESLKLSFGEKVQEQ